MTRRFPWSSVLGVLVALCWSVLPARATSPVKEWTFLVFVNADNNLDDHGLDDHQEMAAAGSNGHLNIVTLFDRFQGPATINFIEKNQVRPIRELGEVDMGDPRVLVQFVKDMVAEFPARHYALVVWNHGSGWKTHPEKGISYDDESGNHITTNQLGAAMADIKGFLGRNLDLLAMDACLMQMLEVAWAVHGSVDFVVASEEVEPIEGYPYTSILGRVTPATTPADFCRLIVQQYGNFYATYEPSDPWEDMTHAGRPGRILDTTQSAIDCAKLPAVKVALDDLCSRLLAGDDDGPLGEAIRTVQRFSTSANVDLADLLARLRAASPDAGLHQLIDRAQATLAGAILVSTATSADEGRAANRGSGRHASLTPRRGFRANGLAIFFPKASAGLLPGYHDLAWAADSLWDDLLVGFFQRSETTALRQAVEAGDIGTLRAWRAAAHAGNREVTDRVLAALRFRVFCEGDLPASRQTEVAACLAPVGTP
ncbi:MAG: hypothetical protein GX442_15395 [Candidatus Riflebacteria bacterium]|nr:hypothetical protein [Candidatus Riflebacteria bacterium]